MCGISGIVNRNRTSFLENISRMTDTLRHRGPDDEGVVFFRDNRRTFHIFGGMDTPEEVYHSQFSYSPTQSFSGEVPEGSILALGHRRLSILDLSPAGHQPMCNEDSTVWIIYNGEIYNFLELQEELESLGHRFVSHTDTEVIIHAYEAWGEQCLDKFNGMWAFVIYDARKHLLFAARDRLGVKPLYYYHDDKILAFASEIKALVELPRVEKRIHHGVLFDYLVLGHSEPEGDTFFQNIFELRPSHAFLYTLSDQRLRTWKYYTLEMTDRWESYDPIQCKRHIDMIRDLIMQAVKLRLQSDVPVGSCLSGGLDSSSIVCVINQLLLQKHFAQVGEQQNVFTASYDMPALDESSWANMVVDKTQTVWHRTFPQSQEFMQDLEDLVYSQDMPFGSTSVYAQYRVMQLARQQGITVLLDGQGGDEVFTGYTPYYRAFFFEMLRRGALQDFYREFKGLGHAPITKQALFSQMLWKEVGVTLIPSRYFELIAQHYLPKEYYNPDFWQAYKERLDKIKSFPALSLNAMSAHYLTSQMLKALLRYEDRNSMQFSIESRTPFADDLALLEGMARIPSVYKIHHGWSKYLLRRAMHDLLPEPIEWRTDKIGFATPELYWLRELEETLNVYFSNDLGEFLNVPHILANWNTLLHGPKRGLAKIWLFINFAVWKKVYTL
ncbi:asparagine synthase (glutamine-hydrolyzing) [candidate division KSB3 bacterium]|uniref:asparagine synthase (glutamine-hydrolyzing) n=1 Tax=candidate division KSB3 bacterium TaxID=2044937 RepID=A0A9D5JRI5_9BACT|nr:asparagine synthase (glutamine-hydrolyzing) [candidate division KSB3 bacterium]